MYNADEIIRDYNHGHSIDYIVDCYYKSKIKKNDKIFVNGRWIISENRFTKLDAKEYVTNILYTFVMKNLKRAD